MICLVLVSLLVLAQDLDAALSSCKENPCNPKARCIDQPDTLYGFSCVCPPGYTGLSCNNIEGRSQDDDPFGPSAKCFNGGQLVKEGLPCKCPPGYSGSLCERPDFAKSSSSFYYNTPCLSSPCMNGGTCKVASTGYVCNCPLNFGGNRCEYSRSRRTGNVLGASVGSSFSSLLLMAAVAFCIYQCCFKRGGAASQRPGGLPFSASFFNRGGGPSGGYTRPMGPGQMGPGPMGPPGGGFPMQPRPGPPGGGMYPMQPPMPHPPGPMMPNQAGFYPNQVYQAPATNQLYKPQDPDEVFRVNAAPPSYDEVTKTTASQSNQQSDSQPQTSAQHQSEANK